MTIKEKNICMFQSFVIFAPQFDNNEDTNPYSRVLPISAIRRNRTAFTLYYGECMDKKIITCIYRITSKKTKKIYIGSATNLTKRKRFHLWQLKKQVHPNRHLQSHYKKYGEKDLIFDILEYVNINELIIKEQFYLDLYTPDFNICKFANSTLGVPCSEEKKEILRKIHTGRKATPAAIEANRLGQLKRLPPTLETRLKLSLNNKGKIRTKEQKHNYILVQNGRKKVLCVTTGVEYLSIRHASRELNILHSCISRACRGDIQKTHGLVFKFA